MGTTRPALRDDGGPPPAPPGVPEVDGLSRIVAAFDLDRTLTRRDTLVLFVLRATGRAATGRAVLAESLRLVLGLTSDARRDAAKEAILVRLLAGRDPAALAAVAESFADDVMSSHLRTDTRDRLDWHRAHQHEVVIVSASPELYVAPLGRRLGVDAVLATRLETGSDGRLTGRISGRNCRGPEKALRLREHLGTGPVILFAYGDSKGDRELLAMATTAVRVGRAPIPGASLDAQYPPGL